MKSLERKETTDIRYLSWADTCQNIGVSPKNHDICVFRKPLSEVNQIPHVHDFFSIIYIQAEKTRMTINGQDYKISPDQLVFLQPNTTHTIEGQDNGSIADTNIYIIVTKHFIQKTMGSAFVHGSVFSNFFLAAFFSNPSDVMIADARPEKARILSLLAQMMEELPKKDPYSDPIISTCCSLLLYHLSRIYQQNSQISPYYRGQAQPEDIRGFIRLYANTVTIQEAAEHFHYYPNYLSQLLKQRYGKTFVEIKREFQMQNACTYLAKTNYPACNIAYLTGFENPNYFSRVFKKEYGVSPQEYRRRCQHAETDAL